MPQSLPGLREQACPGCFCCARFQPKQPPFQIQVGTLFDGRLAREWKILETESAHNGTHVLAQLMGKGGGHAYKVVLIQGTTTTDLDLRVSFLPISGKGDMGGGLIWRATDDRNYYLARANPLEQNIRVYHVVKGIRKMIGNYNEIIDIKKWHRLHVANQDCRIQIFYDEKPIFDLCDETFKEGRIGLWTKSDAITYFDDLQLHIVP